VKQEIKRIEDLLNNLRKFLVFMSTVADHLQLHLDKLAERKSEAFMEQINREETHFYYKSSSFYPRLRRHNDS
jgi:hypothetical protein